MTIHSPSELNPGNRKVCLAIGFFDGVHLGHQQIIRQTITDARQHEAIALVITFDRHPNTVVAPARVPPLIYSLPQKLRAIEGLGADTLLLIHFDKTFSEQTGEAFIRGLVRDLRPSTINSLCVGANFVFGHKRGGNVALLKKLGEELKFTVHGLAAVSLDGKPVSSTRIREAIVAGNLDDASQMLGRAYSVAGTVIRGDRLGHELGFPTANIDATGLALPPNGVYAAHVSLPLHGGRREGRGTAIELSKSSVLPAPSPSPLSEGERVGERGPSARRPLNSMAVEGRPALRSASDEGGGERSVFSTYRAVLNIGHRPTLQNPNPQLRVEAHLLDFAGDLYGQELEIVFVEKLRDEKKFPSFTELRSQIARDIDDAKSRF